MRSTAATAGAFVERDSMLDRDSSDELAANHPEWCVDLGDELRAMNKFELWLALGTGDVDADARVWKVGRECWQPAREIPDLACALKLHAQVLIATVNAARAADEDERSTVVPGELPTPEPARLALDSADEADEAGSTDEPSAIEIEPQAAEASAAEVAPDANPGGGRAMDQLGEVEVEAKSITPGPAVVDAPEAPLAPLPTPIRRRARHAASPLASAAALALLVGTSMFAASRVVGGEAPSAAAHMPSIGVAAQLLPGRPTEASTPSAARVEKPVQAPAPAPESSSRVSASPTDEPTASARTEPRDHRTKAKHVRPTSVSPSHRGQGRQRQHSR